MNLGVVYITKYALTDGVREVEAVSLNEGSYGYVKLKGAPSYGAQMGPKDWHRTQAAGIARAEEMRTAKVASLKRSIEKLEKMDF